MPRDESFVCINEKSNLSRMVILPTIAIAMFLAVPTLKYDFLGVNITNRTDFKSCLPLQALFMISLPSFSSSSHETAVENDGSDCQKRLKLEEAVKSVGLSIQNVAR